MNRPFRLLGFQLLEPLRYHFKLYVGQPLERLPNNQVFTSLIVPGREMVVAQPPHSSPTPPICGHDNYVKPVSRFDLEPLLTPCTRRVVTWERLRHQAFMTLFQRRLHEIFHDLGVPSDDSGSKSLGRCQASKYYPSLRAGEDYQGLSSGLENVEEIESSRDFLDHVVDPVHPGELTH